MTQVASVLGNVVAEIALSALRTTSKGAGRPAVRISGFEEVEVIAIVQAMDEAARATDGVGVVIKVGTSRSIRGLRPDQYLKQGETLTQWRNKDVPALAIIDLETQGDEQGLAALNRLDDISVLAQDDAELATTRLALLVKHAWRNVRRDTAPPGRLSDCLFTVRSAVVDVHDLSLRRWTKYLVAICEELSSVELLTPDAVESAVGGNLAILNLFPDRELFNDERGVRSRLSKNVKASGLRQPNGGPISDDDLLHRIEAVPLDSEIMTRHGITEAAARVQMEEIVHSGGPSESCAIDLDLWLELFEYRVDRVGLGQQIREHLATSNSQRLGEFDDLEVELGLDQSEQDAAEQLLRAEPPQGSPALVDLLAKPLRRRVEKLAFPDAQLEDDPLRALLHALHVLEDVEGPIVELGIEGTPGEWSVWLFAFLYGGTLRDVSQQSLGGPRELQVEDCLLEVRKPALPRDDEDFDLGVAWAPLRLVIEVPGGGRRRFRWDPQSHAGLVAFAALVDLGRAMVQVSNESDLDSFCERFLDPRHWEDAPWAEPRTEDPTVSNLNKIRSAALDKLASGLSADALDEYVAAWASALDDARSLLVPRSAPLPALADVVLADVVQLTDGHLAMLATHPLRLRWVAHHLRRMTKLLVRCLEPGLKLNPENSELFFEWLDRAAPHGTPPFIVGADETVGFSAREVGWHEEYAVLKQGGSEAKDWTSSVDDAAIDEMVSVVNSYVDTYPYKRDGLVLLLLNAEGATRLPLRLTQRLRMRFPKIRLEFHVLAPRNSHHDIVRAFEDAFMEDLADESLFPEVQLVVGEWDGGQAPEFTALRDRVDIALAPALFGTRTTLNRQTRDSSAGISGSYDPWLHPSSYDLPDASQNVVRVMLPQPRDPILESWSTLCVRHDAHSAVAPEQEENTDYFTLQVRFDRHQDLFSALHSVAHWVVTLDAFIGRDQIDQLSDRPDVILVRTGVGKNQAYTLIVSSNTGRRFVVQRLVSKLRFDLALSDDLPFEIVADRFYDVGRNVAPGAVLRALGLGRAANEVVGLVASRYEVARHFPVTGDEAALEVWISFDDHQGWFGRTQRMRADLGRFIFTVDENSESVRLDILVVESKFRQAFDVGAAEQQLDRTTELCRSAFGRGETGDDAEFWFQELASAIEQTSRVQVEDGDLPARRTVGVSRGNLEQTVIQALRSGSVSLADVSGVAVAIASQVSESAGGVTPLGSHKLLRLNRPEFDRVIGGLVSGHAPRPIHQNVMAEVTRTSFSVERPRTDSAEPRADHTPVVRDGRENEMAVSSGPVGLGQEVLQRRYERLLDVLKQHNVSVDPPTADRWLEGPGFYIFRVIPRAGVTVDRVVNRVDEIALVLALPDGVKIRASLDRGAIAFEIPKASEERYPVPAERLWAQSPVAEDKLIVPVGEDVSGQVVTLDFSSPDSPHLLVAGTTGSGKSVALEMLLRGLCRYPEGLLRLHLVDPKGTELVDFEGDAHLDGVIGMDAADAIEILDAAVNEMQRRYEVMKTVRARSLPEYNSKAQTDDRLPWRIIVLDEYADLTSDPEDKSAIEQRLRRLTQKARAAGIHVIAATQRPSADVVSTTIRSNFPAQLALRVKTATDSRIIMDEAGAEALAGQGDAFLKTARGTTRIQVAWVSG